jgi:DUF2934 family protein
MAKRPASQAQAGDIGAPPAQRRARRARDTTLSPAELTRPAAPPEPAASAADEPSAVRNASIPSEEDIRLRAYHRYLERGGGHGMDFEDWLEAERELKQR